MWYVKCFVFVRCDLPNSMHSVFPFLEFKISWFSSSQVTTRAKPLVFRFSRICAWLSVPDASLRSINIEPIGFPSFMLFRMWSAQPILCFGLIWSQTGGLKANCLIPESQLIVYICTVQRFWSIKEVRWWDDSCPCSFLDHCCGQVLTPILKPDGTIPVAMERLMTCAKGFVIMTATFLRKLGGRLSGPAAFLRLSFFSLTNTSETVTGISLKASLVFVLDLHGVDQMKFLNLTDFSFKTPVIFENKQNPLVIDFLLAVQLALMLNDRAGGSLVLVGKIVLIILQHLFCFFCFFWDL